MADSVKIKITGDDSQFSGVLEGLGDKARGTINSVGNTFKGIMASQIVTKGLSMLSNAFRSTMSTGMEFGEAMSKVAATSGATAEEIDILTAKAKEMGATTQFTASEAAEAMNYMAMAGWKTEEMMGGIEGIMHLAAASGEDLATTSDIVTDALTAFGMSADQAGHFADILAAASSNANTNVAMMGETFKYCAPLAGALGYDAEDVAVAIGLMANSGIKASQAGTALQGWLTRLSKPTKESSTAMKALGISMTNADGTMKPFVDLLEETREAFAGLTESQKAEYAAMLAGQRGMSGLLAIVNASEADYQKLSGAITDCAGAAEEMANVRMDNLAGDVKIMQSALEGLQITASESMDGTARTLVQEATGIIDSLNQAGKVGGIDAMFDAALAQIPKLLPKAVKGIQGLLQGLGKRLPGLVKGLMAGLPEMLGGLSELVPGLADALFEGVSQAVESLIYMLPQLLPKLLEGVWKLGESVIKGTVNLFSDGIKALLGVTEREYESFGPISSELTFDVETDANVDISGAEAAATQAWNDFKDELKGYGLTTEQIAQILAFKGTEAELDAYLRANFPNLNDAALRAIKAKFTPMNGASLAGLFSEGQQLGISAEDLARIIVRTDCSEATVQAYLDQYFPDLSAAAKAAVTKAIAGEGGSVGSKLVNELKGLGISDADIAKIITAQATGDTSAIAAILTSRYSGVKQQAYDALSQAWNSGQGHFNTGESGLSFGAQLIIDMFTDGIKDDDASVAAGLETAKSLIEKKRAKLIEYINGGGEDQEGAQNALKLLEQYDQALTDYAENYANASTEVCKQQGETLLAMAQQCQDAVDAIDAQTQRMISIQERVYNLGTGGANLSTEDLAQALGFISATYNQDKEALDKAKKEALETAESAEDYDRIQQQYDDAMQAIIEHRQAMIADLIRGQSGNDTGAMVAAALYGVWDQIEQAADEQGRYLQSDVENILRNAGYGDDIIGKAIQNLFGEQTYKPVQGAESNLGGLDIGAEIKAHLMGYIQNGNLTPETIASELKGTEWENMIPDVISALLAPDNMSAENINLDNVLKYVDFGDLGGIIQTAIDSGMLEGMDSADYLDINELILAMLGDANVDTAGIGADVKSKTEAIGKYIPEGMAEGMSDTSAVEKPAKGLGKAAVDYVAVGAECQSPSAATKRTGEYVAQGLKEGMGDTSSVQAAGKTLGAAAVNAVKGSATGTDAAGRALAAGVARGIAAGRSQVINAAIQLAQATVQAMKEALQIHSPSRVGVGLGANFGEAFGSGLEDSLNTALRSAQTVVGLNNLSPKMDFGGLAGSFGRALQGFADAESDRPVDVYLNGRKVGGTMDRDNARAAAAYNRRVALGYGK